MHTFQISILRICGNECNQNLGWNIPSRKDPRPHKIRCSKGQVLWPTESILNRIVKVLLLQQCCMRHANTLQYFHTLHMEFCCSNCEGKGICGGVLICHEKKSLVIQCELVIEGTECGEQLLRGMRSCIDLSPSIPLQLSWQSMMYVLLAHCSCCLLKNTQYYSE